MSGPLILSQIIASDKSWRNGYLLIAIIQFVLVAVLFFSLPLWKKVSTPTGTEQEVEPAAGSQPEKPVSRGLFYPLQIPGVRFVLVTFLFYCGIESTMGLWGSSYLVRARGLDAATAAAWVSSFYGSITLGRFLAGFITMKISNKQLIRIGQVVILGGVILLFLPLPNIFSLVGFILVGLGCAPIFPGMLHETPVRFGREDAQLVMGFQMAVAYVGATFLPPIFGFIATSTSLGLLPFFVLVYVAAMLFSSERLNVMLAQNAELARQSGLASD